MQSVLVKYKILDEARWRAWCEEVQAREEEAIETLIQEGVVFEACYELEGHVYGIMAAEDLEEAMRVFNESEQPIDEQHAQHLEECLKRVAVGEELYALSPVTSK